MRKKQFFFVFFSELFRLLSENFSDFWPIIQKFVKTTFCVSIGTICGLKYFLKVLNRFDIFCRNLWHGSQISIYVSRVKIEEETVFWFFFSEIFRILSEIFFRLSTKKLQKVVKTTFYVSRGAVCGLNFFLKFWIVLDFLQKPLAWFSNVSLRVQSKNCGRKSFLIYFSEFFRILSEKFFRLSAKKLQKVVKTTFYVSRGTICGLNFY